jgi:phosphoadenosine phosphosulfate reductase
MSNLAHQVLPQRTARDLPSAEELDRALRDAAPAEVIARALQTVGRDHLAVVSSFGTESAALLKVMADVVPRYQWSFSTPAGCSRRRSPIAIP